MDPRLLEPEQWDRIARALTSLTAFVALAMNAALAYLIGQAVIPSLVEMRGGAGGLSWPRRVLYPVSAASLLLALIALGYGLVQAVGVLQRLYPRFLI